MLTTVLELRMIIDIRRIQVGNMNKTPYEEGFEEGMRRCIEIALRSRFKPLSETVRQRLAEWPRDQLDDLTDKIPFAASLKELGLED
jgi:hypothetical protein